MRAETERMKKKKKKKKMMIMIMIMKEPYKRVSERDPISGSDSKTLIKT